MAGIVDSSTITLFCRGNLFPSRCQADFQSVTEQWREIMAQEVKIEGGGLENLSRAAGEASRRGPPPVHLWNPPYCGEIGLRIARDGTWFYQGSPIGRAALVKLFSSILRKDPERYVLVTPVEMIGIEVEDAPFLAVEMTVEAGPALRFRTNVDDEVVVDAAHPLRFEPGPSGGLKPYVLVRGDLWALVSRALYYDLVERGETRDIAGRQMYGVVSSGVFFPMAPADEIENLA
jgi:hypothetical protein